jgi:hypothetical protein
MKDLANNNIVVLSTSDCMRHVKDDVYTLIYHSSEHFGSKKQILIQSGDASCSLQYIETKEDQGRMVEIFECIGLKSEINKKITLRLKVIVKSN